MAQTIDLKLFSNRKITMLMFGFFTVMSSIFFLIFNGDAIVLQTLFQMEHIPASHVVKINTLINTLVSIAGVTGLFLILYWACPNKLNTFGTLLKENKNLNIILSLFVIINILIFSFGNINNPNFWLDEAGQIWMSLGLNHFSPPFSEPGILENVYLNNNNYNMDPGGFTYLLHFWMSFGESPEFIRLLPFLFSLGTITLSLYLIMTNFFKSRLAILLPLVFFGSPLFIQYSFELRAYSFEMLVALSALTLAIQSKKILESPALSFVVGLWMAFGLSSRYSSIFPIALAIAFVSFDVFRSNQKKKYLSLFFIIVPVLLSAILIFIFVLSEQNPSGEPPGYVSDLFLFNRGLFGVFFSRWAILVWLPVVLLLIVSLRQRHNYHLQRYVSYSIFLLLVLLFASALNKYPLAFHTRFDISIHAVFWFGWAILLSLVISTASRFLSDEKYFLFVGYLVALFIVLASFASYYPNDSIYETFKSCYDHENQASILANEGSIPTIKYLFELGPLKSFGKTYMSINFFSESLDNRSIANRPESIVIDNYDYFLFSFFDKDNEIYSKISSSAEFVRCDAKGPSEMYFRLKTN